MVKDDEAAGRWPTIGTPIRRGVSRLSHVVEPSRAEPSRHICCLLSCSLLCQLTATFCSSSATHLVPIGPPVARTGTGAGSQPAGRLSPVAAGPLQGVPRLVQFHFSPETSTKFYFMSNDLCSKTIAAKNNLMTWVWRWGI